MKIASLLKKKSRINLAAPQNPSEQPPMPAPRPPSPVGDKRKRMAIEVPEDAARLLSRSIDEGTSPGDAANPFNALRRPTADSAHSSQSHKSLRERRSSTRSLEFLRVAAEQGMLASLETLPPSPSVAHPELIRKITQWGDEAGSEPEKKQRVRLVRVLVRVLQERGHHLCIDDAALVTDLPPAIASMRDLRGIRIDGLTRLSQTLDLRELVHLKAVDVVHSPKLRLQIPFACEVTLDGTPWRKADDFVPCDAAQLLGTTAHAPAHTEAGKDRRPAFFASMMRRG